MQVQCPLNWLSAEMPKMLLSLLNSRQEEGEPACTVFFWPPRPGSSTQSPENAMHLLLLLSEVRKCTLSLVVRAESSPCADCCAACACRMPAVSTLAQGYRNTPLINCLSLPLWNAKHLSRAEPKEFLWSLDSSYKICLWLKDLMKCMFIGFQCNALLNTE